MLGNVKRLITEQFVRDDYLKETSYDDLKAYELGGKAFYVIDRQSLLAFSCIRLVSQFRTMNGRKYPGHTHDTNNKTGLILINTALCDSLSHP